MAAMWPSVKEGLSCGWGRGGVGCGHAARGSLENAVMMEAGDSI